MRAGEVRVPAPPRQLHTQTYPAFLGQLPGFHTQPIQVPPQNPEGMAAVRHALPLNSKSFILRPQPESHFPQKAFSQCPR